MQRLEALPVAVDLPGVLGEEVAAFVEGEAGWQVVALGGPLTPVLVLGDRPVADVSWVMVTQGQPPAERARTALLSGALDVVAWPHDGQRLLEAPLRVRANRRSPSGPSVFRVAGAGGGAGTSTVALAIAAFVPWRGGRAVVAGDDDLLALAGVAAWKGPGTAELAALDAREAGAEVGTLARLVPGIDGLSVLGGGGGAVGVTDGWPADLVVADLRVPGRLQAADLVVARADRSLLAAADVDVPVVVVGEGPLDRGGVRRALGRPPAGWLPHSARVARAGVGGRVPSAVPGSWLAALQAVLRRVRR